MGGDPHLIREKNQKISFEILRESNHVTWVLLHFLSDVSWHKIISRLHGLIKISRIRTSMSINQLTALCFQRFFSSLRKSEKSIRTGGFNFTHFIFKYIYIYIYIYATVSARFLWWYFRLTLHLARNEVHKFCHQQWCQLNRTQSNTLCTSAFAGHVERMT